MSTLSESVPDEQISTMGSTNKRNLPIIYYATDIRKENMFYKLTNYDSNNNGLFTQQVGIEKQSNIDKRQSFYD